MKSFARLLLAHFDAGKRDLPWRRSPSAYHTLVSELMLQQTVVATVVPYFDRFIARFPDLAALAAAPEADVLTLWSGLGYYSRGRNLHRAAREVMQRHGGTLPADEAALLELPGVGPYTAAAIAAIAYGVRTFPLDGNGARVFARVFNEGKAIDLPAVRVGLRTAALGLVPAERPGDFAQAVMDLGATVCRTTTPRCGACPVARHCGALRAGRAHDLPVRLGKTPKKVVVVSCVAIERGGRVLLLPRPPGTLLGGTFALPAEEGPDAVARAVAAVGLVGDKTPELVGSFRHIFTHRDVTALVYRATATGEPSSALAGRWIGVDDHDGIALSTFTRKALGLLVSGVAAHDTGASRQGAAVRHKRASRTRAANQGKTRMLSPATT